MSRFTDFANALAAHNAAGQWPGTLALATNTVIGLLQDPQAKAVVFGSPEVDAHCQAAGRLAHAALGAPPDAPFDAGLVVHLATELARGGGGHTLALRDAIDAMPERRHVVLITNLHEKTLALDGLFAPAVQVAVAPAGEIAAKTLWLLQALRRLRPGRLVLWNHHYDAPIVAAAQPELAGETVYFHHCDHDMALGLYLPHALHVDCSNVMHERCTRQLGIERAVYWPLVAPDLGARPAPRAWLQHGLTTCSHGSLVKFLSPGRFGYFDVIRRRLAELPGTHLHLGGLPEATLDGFARALEAADIDPSRFVHHAPVPSLWQWLRDSDIDIVISSFPLQGLKGLVETMGAGLPVLMHESTLSNLHSTPHIAYPGVLAWRTPEAFIAALRGLTPAQLEQQARAARRHYESWHHPRELAYALANPRLTAPVPPLGRFVPDTLALYWR